MEKRIILPLDNLDFITSIKIMKETKGLVWGYKLRRTILEKGISVIRHLKQFGNIMVDFKLFDIPTAITESLETHFQNGADISTVHCTADYIPPDNINTQNIVGVTVLTSMSVESFNKYYKGSSIQQTVIEMAKNIVKFNYGYLVCSPLELKYLQDTKIKKICPGIRPIWYDKSDDQNRVSTPSYAIKNGAELLVIGRPIFQAIDIQEAIQKTNIEINESIKEMSDDTNKN